MKQSMVSKTKGKSLKNSSVFFCSGEILIKNWNPLPIETVTENRTVTVQDILGDLMNIAVLQIHISK
jgi:hypothetical protein